MVLAALEVLAVIAGAVGIATIRDTQTTSERTLNLIQHVIDPHGPYERTANERTMQVIACLENHSDRNAARILHVALPPLLPGCPEEGP